MSSGTVCADMQEKSELSLMSEENATSIQRQQEFSGANKWESKPVNTTNAHNKEKEGAKTQVVSVFII